MEWNVMSLPLKDKDEDHYPYPARLRSATHSSPSSQLLSVGSTSSTPTRRRRPFLPQLLLLALALIAITSIFNYPSSLLPPPSFATLEKALDLPTTAYFGDPDLVTSHSVWGAGLNSAVQFEYATFFIDFVDSNGLNSTEAGPLRKEEDMIVTLSGPSLFPAQVKYLSEGRYVVRYRAIDAGTYHLSVTIFKRPAVHKSPYIFWLPLGEQAGYQVEVLKHDRTSVLGDPRAGIEMPKNVCTQVGQNSYGRWLRCEDAKLPCVRYGWVWVNHDCFYPVIDPAEIARQNKWILYIGTSVKRGSFLTALDSLLGDQAHNLTTSRFNKCHGWLDARVDHLRISYLDLRRQCYSLPQEKICSTPNYPDAAETMLRKLGSEHGGPDLVVTEVNYNYDNDFNLLSTFRKAFGSTWKGHFLAGFRSQSPARPPWTGVYPESPNKFTADLAKNPHWEIGELDQKLMSIPLFSTMEFPLERATTDHWHHSCKISGMHTCSVLSDQEFQMIAHYASQLPPRSDQDLIPIDEEERFCWTCHEPDFWIQADRKPTCSSKLLPKNRG